MTLAEILDLLPDDATLPVGWLRTHLDEAGPGPEFGKVAVVCRVVGMSRRFWTERAAKGLIRGVFREGDGPWIFPLAECRAYLLRLNRNRGGRRGPWKAEGAPAGRAGPEAGQAWQVVGGGLAALGSGPADTAGPDRPRLAPVRRADREPGGR